MQEPGLIEKQFAFFHNKKARKVVILGLVCTSRTISDKLGIKVCTFYGRVIKKVVLFIGLLFEGEDNEKNALK